MSATLDGGRRSGAVPAPPRLKAGGPKGRSLSAVPPLMVKTTATPGGPKSVLMDSRPSSPPIGLNSLR